jgi:hypothetical protein
MIAEGEWARIVDVKSITLTDHVGQFSKSEIA